MALRHAQIRTTRFVNLEKPVVALRRGRALFQWLNRPCRRTRSSPTPHAKTPFAAGHPAPLHHAIAPSISVNPIPEWREVAHCGGGDLPAFLRPLRPEDRS